MQKSRDSFDDFAQLWDELSAFPVEQQTEANLHLMRTLAEWLSADYAYWCGLALSSGEIADEDPLNGWRMRISEPYKIPEVYSKNSEELHEDQHLAETIGMASIAIMQQAGQFRARLLRELVDLSKYEESDHFQRFQMPYGLSDRLYVVTPVGANSESCYCFEAAGGDRRFPQEAVVRVANALRSARWFQRRMVLSHGLVDGGEPLNPMERTILLLLLTDRSEKDIARHIDRAYSTTHNYVTSIYRRFGVSNRAGLMSMWVSLH